jgi:hypothetical protein
MGLRGFLAHVRRGHRQLIEPGDKMIYNGNIPVIVITAPDAFGMATLQWPDGTTHQAYVGWLKKP